MSENAAATAILAPKAENVFRGLWASVFYAPPNPPKSVLVCSTNPKEGATAVACGLALAGVGRSEGVSVALVDLNLRSPGVDKRLGLSNGAGASDVLTGAAGLDEALHEDPVLARGERGAGLVRGLLRVRGVLDPVVLRVAFEPREDALDLGAVAVENRTHEALLLGDHHGLEADLLARGRDREAVCAAGLLRHAQEARDVLERHAPSPIAGRPGRT